MLAGPPPGEVEPPAVVARLAAGAPLRCVWANQLGGLTFAAGDGPDRRFVKWAPAGSGIDLGAEAVRMAWVAPFHPVPRVLATGGDGAGSWLVTAPLRGESAVADRWRERPAAAVAAIGDGLRRLHDRAPVGTCPFSWSAERRVATARRRVDEGLTRPASWHPEHRGLAAADALAVLDDPPPVDRLVVCHGDACAPNTLLGANGRWSGHVDLGALGVADRWADLAVATWSTAWNYGPGWEEPLLEAYGVAPDPARTAWYRLLWDLT